MLNTSYDLIILSAGKGKRLGGENKGLLQIGGKSFIENEIDIVSQIGEPSNIVITYRSSELNRLKSRLARHPMIKKVSFIRGGKERAFSVLNALNYLRKSKSHIVLIHDAARPNISKELIYNGIQTAIKFGSAIPAIPCTDTMKLIVENRIIKTIPRDGIYFVQTPQFFNKDLITYAYRKWFEERDNSIPTDDSYLLERIGISPVIIKGDRKNIKITYKEDMEIFNNPTLFRIGFGYDIHRIREGNGLWLGGVLIDKKRSSVAHSDGDVLIHALCDALLGGCGLRDIGYYFPNSEKKYKRISSLILLRETFKLISSYGFKVINIDATVILQAPKIGQFIDEIKDNISNILKIQPAQIGIKATTPEGLGEAGKGSAFSAYCTVLLSK